MLTPRDYQEDGIDAVFDYFSAFDGNPLVLMPTGTGKSIVLGGAAKRMLWQYPQTRVMVATHVETLIRQNFEKLLVMWPTAPAGIYSAGVGRRDYKDSILFVGVQSAYGCAEIFGRIDVLFVDEAHLVSPKDAGMYAILIEGLRKTNPKLKVVGLTATGWRTDNGPLVGDGIFTDVAIDMTTLSAWNWFVDQGYLAPLYSKRTRFELSADGVGMVGNEYNMGQLQKAVDHEQLSRAAIEETIRWGGDRSCWMVFAAGINHADHIADLLCEYGIEAISIHSKSKDPEGRLNAFKRGDYQCAVSMDKLTTGVDVPQIDLIACMRHTMSSSKWVQMLGRGTRPVYAPGFDLTTQEGRVASMAASVKPAGCLVLDFARNTENLGPVNNPIIPERKKKKKGGGGGAPVRCCPVCLEYNPASVRFCQVCRHEFPMKVHMDGTASNLDVMVRDVPAPQVDEMDVERVTYHVHHKLNKPDSLKVSYFTTNYRMFNEYICFEHGGGATRRATNWWNERAQAAPGQPVRIPVSTAEAHSLVECLRIPKKIRVWVNKKTPEIMSYVY